jgi:HlyD family secretion protein
MTTISFTVQRPALALGALALATLLMLAAVPSPAADAPASAPARAALAVTLVQAQPSQLPLRVAANGNIAAWQEASVGTEANGLRLDDVRANVGDVVQRGQVLATFAADAVQADVAQAQASVAEGEAALAEAAANAARARELQNTGALSVQQINQYLTAEKTARARLDAQRALVRSQQLRLKHTQVLAPDAGVISARSATVGAVLPAGQELFRLIRQGRLEWRAEVQAAELASLQPGMAVTLTPTGGQPVAGKLRKVAPTVDPSTRNGIVYVDLTAPGSARAGMFARGEFVLGQSQALTLPQSAVQLRDGFAYVMQLGAANKVAQRKVVTGRRLGERIEIVSGLAAGAQVVASGGAFLSDGDTVRVVPATAPANAPANAPAAAPAAAK